MTTANTNARAIDALREEIDTLDQELLALMEKRLDLAAAIAAAKSDDSKTEDANELLLRPAREASVIDRLGTLTLSVTWGQLKRKLWVFCGRAGVADQSYPQVVYELRCNADRRGKNGVQFGQKNIDLRHSWDESGCGYRVWCFRAETPHPIPTPTFVPGMPQVNIFLAELDTILTSTICVATQLIHNLWITLVGDACPSTENPQLSLQLSPRDR